MSTPTHPWAQYELGVVTIELTSPFIIGASESDGLFDATFVTDANGYPTLPGESLAGILRHAAEVDWGRATTQKVFGFQDRGDGASSGVRISFGQVHDKSDTPVPMRLSLKALEERKSDAVLTTLSAGTGRDHVRIGAHGAVDGRGKFDERIVPAGARFSFELCVSAHSPKRLGDLVELLRRSETHLGAGSRRGYGRFTVVRAHSTTLDLTQPKELDRLAKIPVDLASLHGSSELKPLLSANELSKKVRSAATWRVGTIYLTPIGTWMVGNGSTTDNLPSRSEDKDWDRVPLSESQIAWEEKGGRTLGRVLAEREARWLLPASSIKGAVRHRVGFHARRFTGALKVAGGAGWSTSELEATEAERELFGTEAEREKQPGRVFFGEVRVDPSKVKTVGLQHVSLDRFTQGPMDHLLYDEVALGRCELAIDVEVCIGSPEQPYVSSAARKALAAALGDLCKGRLALGAGRGHGRFCGRIEWAGEPLCAEEEKA